MAENVLPGSAGKPAVTADGRGIPYYEKLRRDLRDTLQKKRALDKSMAHIEEQIYRHETTYLEETSAAGNIIKGFDNYIKSSVGTVASTGGGGGTISGSAAGGGPGAGRRKTAINDADRVFSRSSVNFMRDSDSPTSAQSTPNHAGTPTGSFGPEKGDKKKKKAAVAEESETDGGRANKRQKITFGQRKRDDD